MKMDKYINEASNNGENIKWKVSNYRSLLLNAATESFELNKKTNKNFLYLITE